ncbi:uncharacterized protein LOC125648336 [Ostrea edulis]|uniref:uncharacterized protein LOC125648336 n=1 Tax=Ostrea edulis TaxID=37623 RepID=UPI0024AFF534|nr:uncharacterized protein LOC125648336 [Ostrea edulis]
MASAGKRRRLSETAASFIVDSLLLLEVADTLENLCSVNPSKNVLILPMKMKNSNAAHSGEGCSFSKAYCDVANKETGFYFVDVFRRGLDMLLEFVHDKKLPEKTQEKFILRKLLEFLSADECISDVQGLTETELTATLANHLFGKLATTANYVMDAKCAGKKTNQCLCGGKDCILTGRYGDTSIGNAEVWHGNIKIILNGNCVIEPDSGNQGGTTTLSTNPQIIAETVVFSFLQKQNHPERETFLAPCIGVRYSDLFVMFYDAEHDVLLESCRIPLAKAKEPNKFSVTAVIVSWMVVNYKFLCTGLTEEMINFYKAEFFEQAGSKLDVYKVKLYMGNVTSLQTTVAKPRQFPGRENPYMIERRKTLKEAVEQCEEKFSHAGFTRGHLSHN